MESSAQPSPISEFDADFPLLVEAGFIAIKQLDEVSALRLFAAAQALRPQDTTPQVGVGYLLLNKMELKKAIVAFEGVLKVEPGHELATTFLGICWMLTKERAKGEEALQRISTKTSDPAIKTLAQRGLVLTAQTSDQGGTSGKKAPFFEK